MQFTDLLFLFVFFPTVVILYYLLHVQYRKYILIVFSIIFFACVSPQYIGFMAVSMIGNICLAHCILRLNGESDSSQENKREKSLREMLLLFGVTLNIAVLGCYKYADFIFQKMNNVWGFHFQALNLLLPLGLSFYTFKAISYLIDCSTDKAKKIRGRLYENPKNMRVKSVSTPVGV